MADAYEREYMAGKGEVLYRHKVDSLKLGIGLGAGIPFGITALLSLFFLLTTPMPTMAALSPVLAGAVGAAIVTALSIVFGVARVTVSEGELHIQMGPAGPRIPIEEIESIDIGASGVRSYGLGYQKLLDGTSIYKMFGKNDRAVRITKRGDSNKLVLVMKDPDGLVAALREAQSRAAGKPKVRVELEENAEEELEQESEDEARAER